MDKDRDDDDDKSILKFSGYRGRKLEVVERIIKQVL